MYQQLAGPEKQEERGVRNRHYSRSEWSAESCMRDLRWGAVRELSDVQVTIIPGIPMRALPAQQEQRGILDNGWKKDGSFPPTGIGLDQGRRNRVRTG